MEARGDAAEALTTGETVVVPASGIGQKQATVRDMTTSVEKKRNGTDGIGLFFLALLIFWFLSVIWKIGEGQTNLWPIFASCIFFETVNRVLSSLVLCPSFLPGLREKNVDNFLNTAVSLLHSTSVAFTGMTA